MNAEATEFLLKKYGKKNPPQVKSGDTVRVHQRIKEGDKERIQIFEGLVISTKHGSGLDGSFTVRKLAAGGVGVERTYPVHSPNILKVERLKTAQVSRTKLYYMRGLRGKSARFKVELKNPGLWEERGTEKLIEQIEEQVAEAAEAAAEEKAAEEETEGQPETATEAVAETKAEKAKDEAEEVAETPEEAPAEEKPAEAEEAKEEKAA